MRARAVRPRCGRWSETSADGPTCDRSPASSRTSACADTYGSRDRAPWACAVIDLRFLAGSGDDHHASFGCFCATQLARETLHALVAAGEAVLIHQILVDGHGIAAAAESQLDGLADRFASAGARTGLRRRNWLRGKSAHFVSWEGVGVGDHLRVGNHLVGRF